MVRALQPLFLNFGTRCLLSRVNMLGVEKQQFDLLVNGELIGAASGKYFELVNPSTGEAFARVADATPEDVNKAISAARREFDQGTWRGMTIAERGIYLKKIVAPDT